MLKRTSIIFLGWDRIAKIVVSQVEGGKVPEVNWINSLVEGANIDKAAVLARYKLACASAGVDLPWSLYHCQPPLPEGPPKSSRILECTCSNLHRSDNPEA